MKIVDLAQVKELHEILLTLEEGEPLVFVKGREEQYILVDANTYDQMHKALINDVEKNPMKYFDPSKLEIQVFSDPNKPQLSLEEYEDIKRRLNDALEKSLKPKTKYKLNQS